jgi:hypothetical protein
LWASDYDSATDELNELEPSTAAINRNRYGAFVFLGHVPAAVFTSKAKGTGKFGAT